MAPTCTRDGDKALGFQGPHTDADMPLVAPTARTSSRWLAVTIPRLRASAAYTYCTMHRWNRARRATAICLSSSDFRLAHHLLPRPHILLFDFAIRDPRRACTRLQQFPLSLHTQ